MLSAVHGVLDLVLFPLLDRVLNFVNPGSGAPPGETPAPSGGTPDGAPDPEPAAPEQRPVQTELGEGVTYGCEVCGGGPEWMGQGLRLLSHTLWEKGEDGTTNETHRVLCPNCHQQAEEKRKRQWGHGDNRCVDCDSLVSKGATRCWECYTRSRRDCSRPKAPRKTKADYPPVDELYRMVEERGYCAVAAELGVSDTAVRKYLKRHGDLPETKRFGRTRRTQREEKRGVECPPAPTDLHFPAAIPEGSVGVGDVARSFGMDPTTLRRRIRRGVLRAMKVGGTYLVPLESLVGFK